MTMSYIASPERRSWSLVAQKARKVTSAMTAQPDAEDDRPLRRAGALAQLERRDRPDAVPAHRRSSVAAR